MTLLDDQRAYWNRHPIGVEIFDAEPGSKEFYDQYIPYYDNFYAESRRAMRYDQYAGKHVLEVGCGLGANAMHFAQAGAQVTALDLSDTAVQCTQRLFIHRGLRGDIRQGNAERLPFRDDTFDMVCCLGVLMLVPDIDAAIGQIYRVLRPGGEVLAMLYNRWSWYWLLVLLSGVNVESERGDPPLNRVHSRRELKHLFRRFSSLTVTCERSPQETMRRSGLLAHCYNRAFIPLYRRLPNRLTRELGWHLIVRGVKPLPTTATTKV